MSKRKLTADLRIDMRHQRSEQGGAYDIAGAQIIGDRETQEDAFLFEPIGERVFAAVADGLGGHPFGEVASELVVRTMRDAVVEDHVQGTAPDPAASLQRGLEAAHRAILAAVEQRPELADMGTTLACVIVEPRTRRVWAGLVGDSRVMFRRNGRLFDACDGKLLKRWGCGNARVRHAVGLALPGANAWIRQVSGDAIDLILIGSDGIEALPATKLFMALDSIRGSLEIVKRVLRSVYRLRIEYQDNATLVAVKLLPVLRSIDVA